MKPLPLAFILFITPAFISFYSRSSGVPGQNFQVSGNKNAIQIPTRSLSLKTTIPLPNVKGSFDLMALDGDRKRLFVSAQDNHTLEVIDLATNKPLLSIPNLNEPKWVFYWSRQDEVYVSTGGDGRVTQLNGTNYAETRLYTFKEKCNNLRYDSTTGQLLVGVGKTFGALGIIDLANHKIAGEIHLSDYPKQFEIDGDLVYVNEPEMGQIEVISLSAKKVVKAWNLKAALQNTPMAIDRKNKRLFIACDTGKFIILSTTSGQEIQRIVIHKNADGIYYDGKRKLLYVSCGEGFIDVIRQQNANHYQIEGTIPTTKGAATSLFSPSTDNYYLAIPQSANTPAEIRIYKPLHS